MTSYNLIIDHINRINALIMQEGGATELEAHKTAQGYKLHAKNGAGLDSLSPAMTAGAFNDALGILKNFILQEARGGKIS